MESSSHSLEPIRQRILFTQSQKNTLLEWYDHNPYPGADDMKQLAKMIHVPESKLKNWFNNYRRQQKVLEQDQSKASTHQVPFTRLQVGFLKRAFKKNRVPNLASRKEMAMKVGIKESRIQKWFEKQRTLNSEHREDPMNLLEDGKNGGPHPAAQQQYVNLVTPPVSCPLPSDLCCDGQTSPPVPPASQVFVLWDSFGVFGSQAASTLTMQATEAVQGGQNPDRPPHTSDPHRNHSPEQPLPGQDFSDTQAPFYSQPDTEHEKQQSEDPDYTDISYILQWWDKGRLDLIAQWEPLKET